MPESEAALLRRAAKTAQWAPNPQWQALMTAESGPLAFTRGYMLGGRALGVFAVPAPDGDDHQEEKWPD